MKKPKQVRKMYAYIVNLQRDAEHKLAEHNLSEYERRNLERLLLNTGAEAQVLEWVMN